MTQDVAGLPEWSQAWATTRQAQHGKAGHTTSAEDWKGLRDWLATLPALRPKMVAKIYKLSLNQALMASHRSPIPCPAPSSMQSLDILYPVPWNRLLEHACPGPGVPAACPCTTITTIQCVG